MLPSQFVGHTLYLEFQSFNQVGGGLQPLGGLTVYAYVPQGSSVVPGIFPQAVRADSIGAVEIGSGTNRSDSFLALEQQRTAVLGNAQTPVEARANARQDWAAPGESRTLQGRDNQPPIEEQATSRSDAAIRFEPQVTALGDAQIPTENR